MNTEVNIKGMHCKSCGILIKDSLLETEGVKEVLISHEAGKAKVDFDESKVSLDKIKQLIKKEGFEVE